MCRCSARKKGAKTKGGVIKPSPPCSRLLSTEHVLGHEVGPTAPGHRDRTRGRPFLAWEAWGRSRRA
jgi:hypothetical protein